MKQKKMILFSQITTKDINKSYFAFIIVQADFLS